MVRLKKGQETFQIVEGPDAGKTFERDAEYSQAPVGYESRFEKIKIKKPVEVKPTEKKRGKK